MFIPFKKIIAAFVLVSFVTLVFFSFAFMIHGSDGQMSSDCLFAFMGESFCPQDVVAMAVHHVASYQSFLNVTTNSVMAFLVLVLSFITFAVAVFLIGEFLSDRQLLVSFLYDPPPIISSKIKITRWLSLFENSASLN